LPEKPFIQKLFAFVLLVCLTIGLIPQQYFHDVIADHEDTAVCQHPDQSQPCVHQKGYNCGFSDLAVSAPYTFQPADFSFYRPAHFSFYTPFYQLVLLQNCCSGKTGRGPPSVFVA
jgi:hypothetical protein